MVRTYALEEKYKEEARREGLAREIQSIRAMDSPENRMREDRMAQLRQQREERKAHLEQEKAQQEVAERQREAAQRQIGQERRAEEEIQRQDDERQGQEDREAAKRAAREKWKNRGVAAAQTGWDVTKSAVQRGYYGVKSGAGMMGGVAAAGLGGAMAFGWANVFIFLSILLYISDLGTRFNGININKFLASISSFNWQMILANGVVLVIIISYYLINRPAMRDGISFAVLVELFSLIFFLGGFTFGIFHIIFAILIYIFLIRPTAADIATANYTLAILLAFDFFGYGLLDKYVPGILANRLIIPIWFYYSLLLTSQTQKSFFTKAVIIFVVLLNVAVFAYGINQSYNIGKPLTSQDYYEAVEFSQTGLQGIKKMWDGLFAAVTTGVEKRLEYATGGYYESEVEENEKEPLGVYLEDVQPADSEYFEDEPVIIWATLKARTLDPDKPVKINVDCSAGETKGKVTPETEFEIYAAEEEDISCKFDSLKSSSNTIDIFAGFNFKTMAYLKSYFMHQETLRALKRQNIDVFDEYGITDREPISKSTNGPVNLGIGTKAPPIGIYKEGEGVNVMPKLGVTITNQWDGEIKEIKSLIIQIPDSLVIEPGYCDHEFIESSLQESGFNIYELKNPNDNKLKNITEYVTFNCRLQVRDPIRLLGETPVSVKYFRATAEYTYNTKKQITLNIKEVKSDENSYMGAESEARPKQGCYGKEEAACKTTNLCFASYVDGKFKECNECATDRRDCTKINKVNFCPDDFKKCEAYCNQDPQGPCYHYCKWKWADEEKKEIGSCVNKDLNDIRKELEWPLNGGKTIIKCYENKGEDRYYGIAIKAEENDDVLAAGDGIIYVSNDDWTTNHAIEIQHYTGFKTYYKNLKLKEGTDIKDLKWKPVKKGEVIGQVGDYRTKETKEIYLYFATLENNQKVNPLIGDLEIRGYYKPESLDLRFEEDPNCCKPGNDMESTCQTFKEVKASFT